MRRLLGLPLCHVWEPFTLAETPGATQQPTEDQNLGTISLGPQPEGTLLGWPRPHPSARRPPDSEQWTGVGSRWTLLQSGAFSAAWRIPTLTAWPQSCDCPP